MRRFVASVFVLIICIAVAASMAQGGSTANKSVRNDMQSISAPQVAAGHPQSKQKRKGTARKNWRKRGQQAMKPRRVREIQMALIRKSYLKGRANGVWDERSRHAMARFQSENGWQSKVVPDSRALIKLGLGPEYAGLLNPETAVIAR